MEQEYALSDGSTFSIYDHIDEVLVTEESRESWTAKEPRVWPSAASVELYDQTQFKIAGKCHRQTFLGMIGTPATRGMTPEGAMIMVMGRLLEERLTHYVKQEVNDRPSLHVASGIRILIPDILLSFELDIVVLNPKTFQGVLTEAKTFSSKNYAKAKDILKDGKPALDNLMQIALYLLEIKNGGNLKVHISNGLADRKMKDEKNRELVACGLKPLAHRNRIEVSHHNLEVMDNGPLAAKLIYLDRAAGFRKEFDISIEEDPFDGLTYPVIDGEVWKLFPLEGIYARYKTLQRYFYEARSAAEMILLEKGIEPPAELHDMLPTPEQIAEFKLAETLYYDHLGEAMRSLPSSYWPPAEYDFDYSQEKIEKLWTKGLIAKTKYEGWKKKHKGKERIGDWNCQYCDYGLACLKVEKPQLAYLLADIQPAMEEE